MDSFNCPSCGTALPTRAKYCAKCKEPVKCQECGDLLEAGAEACVECGADVIRKNSTATATTSHTLMNTVDYSESTTKKGSSRKLRASFTNDVGNGIGNTILHLMGNRVPIKNGKATNTQLVEIQEEVQDADVQEEPAVPVKQLPAPANEDLTLLNQIFNLSGEHPDLRNSKLKPRNRKDYGKRLTCLYLYLRKLNGYDTAPRADITLIAKQAAVEDGNFRTWINKESTLVRQNGDDVTLLVPGEDFAKEVLQEIRDPNVPESWKLIPPKKRSGKGKDKKEGGDDV